MAATLVKRASRANMLPSAEPNVIPFIDVLLVLLIIFMVTAPKATVDLRLDMARAEPGRAAMIEPTIVELREDAVAGYRLFVGDQETTIADVARRTFAHIVAADPSLVREDVLRDGRVYIRADLDVAYQNVVSVVDTLQDEGFLKVSVAAQNADEE